jgi:hypothetical protein
MHLCHWSGGYELPLLVGAAIGRPLLQLQALRAAAGVARRPRPRRGSMTRVPQCLARPAAVATIREPGHARGTVRHRSAPATRPTVQRRAAGPAIATPSAPAESSGPRRAATACGAVDGKDSFVKLFTGSFDHVLGVSVAADTATGWVKGIGWFDIAVAAVMVLMLTGAILGKGALYRLAYSPVALAVYGWGAVWGFATAASRVTAVGEFYPEVWDVVERAPNFLLPAALIWLVYQHRLDHRPTSTTTESIHTSAQLTK